MSGIWKEVARLQFKGERFQDHALDLSALTELGRFQKIVSETAKALWRAANPARERMPAHFEQRTRLCLRSIEEGSAVAPLEVLLADDDQAEFWDRGAVEVSQAVGLAYDTFQAVARDHPLPDQLPRDLIADYAEWGQSLGAGETIMLHIPKREHPASVSAATSGKLAVFLDQPHQDTVDLIGHVLEADMRLQRFQIWKDERTAVSVPLLEQYEEQVATALREHRSVRVQVSGRAEVSPVGTVLRFLTLDRLRLLQPDTPLFENGVLIEDTLSNIWDDVPDSEWQKIPDDLNRNLDHYLYGRPRR